MTYRIVINGINTGAAKQEVVNRLASLFKTSEEKVVAILESPGFVVKKGVDLQEAAQYEAALKNCGCVCTVEPESQSDMVFDVDAAVSNRAADHSKQSAARGEMHQSETAYYASKFQVFDKEGSGFKPTFNGAALLFGVFWYFYKGMWAKGALMIALIVLLAGMPAPFFWLYAAIAGNYDYYLLRRYRTQLWSKSGY